LHYGIRQIGITENSKIVLDGFDVFKFVETLGVPFEVVLELVNKENFVIDWIGFFETSFNTGWSLKTLLNRIENPIIDILGREYFKRVKQNLDFWYFSIYNREK
jgi:hypothetical protein